VSKTLEAKVDQFVLGFKFPVSRSIVMQEQDHLGDFTTGQLFSFKCPSIAPAEIGNIPR
jgi:hypothetical protein